MILTTLLPNLFILNSLPFALATNITIDQLNVPSIRTLYPPPRPFTQASEILPLFFNLARSTSWNLVNKIHLDGDTGEAEGMAIIHHPDSINPPSSPISRIFIAAGDWTQPTKSFGNHTIINGIDRSNGAGYTHIVVYDGSGKRSLMLH